MHPEGCMRSEGGGNGRWWDDAVVVVGKEGWRKTLEEGAGTVVVM